MKEIREKVGLEWGGYKRGFLGLKVLEIWGKFKKNSDFRVGNWRKWYE